MNELWDLVSKNLSVIIPIIISIIALVFSIAAFFYKRNLDLPTISASVYRQSNNLPPIIDFKVNMYPKWQVAGACLWRMKACLASANKPFIRDKILGSPEGWDTTESWRRCLTFDPPVSKGCIILHPDRLCCMKTGGAVLPPVSCDLCFFGYRIGLGFGQRPHPVEHGTAHPCFGLLVG